MKPTVEIHDFLTSSKRVFILDVVGTTVYARGPYIILCKVYKGPKITGFDLLADDERKILVYKNVKREKLIPESWLCPNLVKINNPESAVNPAGREKPLSE